MITKFILPFVHPTANQSQLKEEMLNQSSDWMHQILSSQRPSIKLGEIGPFYILAF